MYDVICVGSNTYDVFVKTDAEVREVISHQVINGKNTHISDKGIVYPVGDKILINHLDFQIGGGGTNCAVALAKLGFKTAYLGKIGRDDNGVKVYECLKNSNVDFIGSLGDQTGFSVILDSVYEDRTILTSKGCNDQLKYSELDLKKTDTKMLYCSSMMGESFETLKKIITYFKKKGAIVSFNPSLYMTKDKRINTILKNLDLLIFNKEEAFSLSGTEDLKSAFSHLQSKVKGIIVITDGKNGAYCLHKKKVYRALPNKKLKIVETTGAGDAFASGFSSGLLEKADIKECMLRGLILSEAVIQDYGAKTNLLTEKNLRSKLKKDKRKVEIIKL